MRLVHFSLLAILLTFAGDVAAQTQPNVPTYGKRRMVQDWYRQFLSREADPQGLGHFTQSLYKGTPPEKVLSEMLAGDEFYNLAGGTPEGFIREMYQGGTGRQPNRNELREWMQKIGPNPDRRAMAEAFLQRFPQGWQVAANPIEQDHLNAAHEASRRLADQIERLSDDIVFDLEGVRERDLYRKADKALADLRNFERVLRPGITRDQALREFGPLDASINELTQSTRQQAPGNRRLARDADRVAETKALMQQALALGDTSHANDAMRHQARALAVQAADLQRMLSYTLADEPNGQRIIRNGTQFVNSANNVQRWADAGTDQAALKREVQNLTNQWASVTRDLNRVQVKPGTYILRERAQKVDDLTAGVAQAAGVPRPASGPIMPRRGGN